MSFIKGINPGRFKRRLSICGYREIDSELGGKKVALAKKACVWGEIKPVRGNEYLEYYKDTNSLQHKITIRYLKGLTEKDVIVYNGRQFEISSIININEENVYLEIYCTETKEKTIP